MLMKRAMKQSVRKQWAAMIIGMSLIWPVANLAGAADEAVLPTPTAFAVNMELGDLGQAEAWLDAGLPPDFLGSRIGSGLMIGAWENNLDLMRLFLSRGADINQVNSNGETPIVLAALRGHLNAVKWLVDRGARINAPNRQWSALHYAVFSGHVEVADYLIDQGADIQARTTNGSTVLMMAIYEGREDLARKLIEKGADRSPKNDWGDGAMEWAMRFNHLNIARLVSQPDEFNVAVSQPKEKWGEPSRSIRMSKELESLIGMREILVQRGLSIDAIDKRIAAERVRIVRSEFDRQAPTTRAATLEISASRKKPQEQSTQIIYDNKGKAVGYKAPPATYTGTPKMPLKTPVKDY